MWSRIKNLFKCKPTSKEWIWELQVPERELYPSLVDVKSSRGDVFIVPKGSTKGIEIDTQYLVLEVDASTPNVKLALTRKDIEFLDGLLASKVLNPVRNLSTTLPLKILV